MNRIILGMAAANYALLALTVYFGIASQPPDDWNSLADEAFRYHFPLGIFTAIFSLLVHCLVFTYFLGTTRWVRETASAYALEETYVAQSRTCRSRAFAMAMASMLLVIATVASGAGAHTKVWPSWVHQWMPAVTYVFMLWAYRVEYGAIDAHILLTDRVMVEVSQIRAARGQLVE